MSNVRPEWPYTIKTDPKTGRAAIEVRSGGSEAVVGRLGTIAAHLQQAGWIVGPQFRDGYPTEQPREPEPDDPDSI